MAGGAAKSRPTPPVGRAPKRRGRPVDQRSDDTRAAILTTAQRLFGEAGFRGASMDRIATASDLTVRALYHYFPSKRDLFRAATEEAIVRFGAEVAVKVFSHDNLADRVRGYLDVYRSLHASDPHVLAFIGVVLVEAIAEDREGGSADTSTAGADLHDASVPLRAFLAALVDEAIARGEVHPDTDRDGAMLLLETFGMGLCLAALDTTGSFTAMLDSFERLTDGTLFVR